MMPSRRCCSVFGEIGLTRNSCTPSRIAVVTRDCSPRSVSMMIGRFALGKTPGDAHDAHDLAAVQDRHVPVHDHDVRIDVADGVKRGDAVAAS